MPISKWNRLVYELDICKELEEVQWSRSSGGTQWRFPIMSFSKLYSVHPIIRDKMVPSLFEEWKKKSSDRFLLLLLSVSPQGERTSFLTKEMTKCTWQFRKRLHERFEQLTEKRKKCQHHKQPRLLSPNLPLSWYNCCFWREAYQTTTPGHSAHQPRAADRCVPGSGHPPPVTWTQNPPLN